MGYSLTLDVADCCCPVSSSSSSSSPTSDYCSIGCGMPEVVYCTISGSGSGCDCNFDGTYALTYTPYSPIGWVSAAITACNPPQDIYLSLFCPGQFCYNASPPYCTCVDGTYFTTAYYPYYQVCWNLYANYVGGPYGGILGNTNPCSCLIATADSATCDPVSIQFSNCNLSWFLSTCTGITEVITE